MTAAIGAAAADVLPEDVVLRVSDLSVIVGDHPLVQDVSFEIGRQERVGLIGASGSARP